MGIRSKTVNPIHYLEASLYLLFNHLVFLSAPNSFIYKSELICVFNFKAAFCGIFVICKIMIILLIFVSFTRRILHEELS